MVEPIEIALQVNGTPVEQRVDPRTTLTDLLRDRLGLTGTHLGCEQGVCGSCTVLLDGRTARACITLAAQASGGTVWTVEGLSPPTGLSRLQEAFRQEHGLQCGFCTPGFLAAATELLVAARGGGPDGDGCSGGGLDEATVREALSGNICRCTGYQGIVDAVLAAAAEATAGRAAAGDVAGGAAGDAVRDAAGDGVALPGADAVATGLDVGELTGPPELTPAPAEARGRSPVPTAAAGGERRTGQVVAEALAHVAVFATAAYAAAVALRRRRRR